MYLTGRTLPSIHKALTSIPSISKRVVNKYIFRTNIGHLWVQVKGLGILNTECL